jgi:hypothetical protein
VVYITIRQEKPQEDKTNLVVKVECFPVLLNRSRGCINPGRKKKENKTHGVKPYPSSHQSDTYDERNNARIRIGLLGSVKYGQVVRIKAKLFL